MALKTTIIVNKNTSKNISEILPRWSLFSRLKHSVNKAHFIFLLILIAFSIKGNAQCTITGTTVNSSTINCVLLSGCTIVYVGDGVNPTNLVMNQDIELICLGAIQFIVRNNASIDFSNGNFDLELAANSSIIIESGGNISAGTNCSASDLIKIGGVKVASCNGNGGALTDFPNLVSGGGYNTVNATSTIICGSGTSTITAVKNPIPTSATSYSLFNVATGGTAIQTINTSSPYIASFITPFLTSTTNYFIEATTSGVTTPRRQVTITVVPIPTITGTTPASRCGTGTVTLGATASAGTINWYAAPTGGTSLGNGTNYTTPTISTNTTYWVDATTNGCITGTRTAVTATVNAAMTVGVPSSNPTLCIGTALTNITHSTTGATGIGAATNLPAGVTAAWATNVITISGTPTAAGTFNYSIPLTGGCGTVNATGAITVTPLPATPTIGTITQPTCLVATGSVVLSGLPAVGTWTINPDAIAGTGTSIINFKWFGKIINT